MIVTVLCDGATKYLSEPFWNDARLMIKIETAWDVMVAHAEAKFPNECCGAMIGRIDGDQKHVTTRFRWKTPTPARKARAMSCVPKICSSRPNARAPRGWI